MRIDKDIIYDINHKANIRGHGRFAQEKIPLLCPQPWLEPQEGDRTATQRHEKADYQSTAEHHGC